MKPIRAKPKKIEDLPEWAKCCKALVATGFSSQEPFLLDLDDIQIMPPARCQFCRKIMPENRKGAMRIGTQNLCSLELVELDEGGSEDKSGAGKGDGKPK